MKTFLFLFCLLPVGAVAIERGQLDGMLVTAAAAQSNAYIEARGVIVALGTNALPLLAKAASDQKLSWQQRLTARICCERIARGGDIEALRRYDWRTHPAYDREWEKYRIGARFKMTDIVEGKCRETGLWHYYIELAWKKTGEEAVYWDPRINETWRMWCWGAVGKQPEEYWRLLATIERLDGSDFSDKNDVMMYKNLVIAKESTAIPMLLRKLDVYVRATGPALLPPDEIERTVAWKLEPLISFADSRHVELFEKFMAERPALAELKPRLADVRARPAPPEKTEPPFRLGTTPVLTP